MKERKEGFLLFAFEAKWSRRGAGGDGEGGATPCCGWKGVRREIRKRRRARKRRKSRRKRRKRRKEEEGGAKKRKREQLWRSCPDTERSRAN